MFNFALGFVVAMGFVGVVVASDEPPSPVVELLFTSTGEQKHDQVSVQFYLNVRHDDRNTALAEVNSKMAEAIKLSRSLGVGDGFSTLSLSDRFDMRRDPKTGKAIHNGFVVEQSAKLDIPSDVNVGRIIGELSSVLSVRSMRTYLSSDKGSAFEDGLIDFALKGFQARASLAVRSIGYQDFAIKNVSVACGVDAPPMYPAQMSRSTAAESSVPVTVEPGQSVVSCTASGSVLALNRKIKVH